MNTCWCGLPTGHSGDARLYTGANVAAMLPLVKRRVLRRQYRPTVDDMVQEGLLAVYKAAKTYRPERSDQFPHYAVWEIDKAITACAFQNRSIAHIPKYPWRKSDSLDAAMRDGVTTDYMSSDSPPSDMLVHAERVLDVAGKDLPLVYDFLEGLSGEESGRRHGISRERVRQRLQRARERMNRYDQE